MKDVVILDAGPMVSGVDRLAPLTPLVQQS